MKTIRWIVLFLTGFTIVQCRPAYYDRMSMFSTTRHYAQPVADDHYSSPSTAEGGDLIDTFIKVLREQLPQLPEPAVTPQPKVEAMDLCRVLDVLQRRLRGNKTQTPPCTTVSSKCTTTSTRCVSTTTSNRCVSTTTTPGCVSTPTSTKSPSTTVTPCSSTTVMPCNTSLPGRIECQPLPSQEKKPPSDPPDIIDHIKLLLNDLVDLNLRKNTTKMPKDS